MTNCNKKKITNTPTESPVNTDVEAPAETPIETSCKTSTPLLDCDINNEIPDKPPPKRRGRKPKSVNNTQINTTINPPVSIKSDMSILSLPYVLSDSQRQRIREY